VARHSPRAPLAPPMLVGALGLAGGDLRRYGTCALVAMVGLAACVTAMGDGRADGEGASDTSARDGGTTWPTIGRSNRRTCGAGRGANE
jgi:hypothetical protein